ncbi:LiaF domain-containing protein [Rhodococcus sp. NPDC049939]|uniref:LiaF domain-containing protein n=1 Tax=Rhodococcus sp. NPDC049939 TaxID=3155511 RepID=UPI0033C9B594
MTAAGDSREIDRLRESAQTRLEKAVGEGQLTLEEYSEQAAIVWSRDVSVERLRGLASVDVAMSPVSRPQSTIIGIFGDIKRSGRWSLAVQTLVMLVFGDVKLNLRSAVIGARISTITLASVFGDSTITVPEGVHVELGGFTVFGDRELGSGAKDPGPGAPTIRVVSYSLFGDLKVRTR